MTRSRIPTLGPMPARLAACGSALLALAAAAPAAAQEDCGRVSVTEMDWASAAIVTEVSAFLLAQGYGCEVARVPSSNLPALVSVSETGTPDIVTELWTNGVPFYQELRDEGRIEPVADVLSDGGYGGWWVPDYLVEAHPELATVEGALANPELLGGRFHTCPDGWSCALDTADLIDAFDVPEAGFDVFQHGSGETLAGSIAAAYENREPWFGYYWAPTAILGKYPMVKVDLGPYDAEAYDCALSPDCSGAGRSSYPVTPVKTVVTREFAETQPELAELMGNVSFTNAKMSEILAWQEDNNASAEEAAVWFLRTSPDIWGSWLNADGRQALGGLLDPGR